LIPSELFGHEAGAFTGATKRRVGRFELAARGTLFLDEIAEISAETQVLLLRVLQNRTLERVGGNESIAVDARLIAATNRWLNEEIQAGKFRSDLFYRLNVFPIHLPPLRERRDDLPRLIEGFLQRFNLRMNKQIKRIGSAMLDRLMEYSWPGNVRELENIIERAVIITPGETLHIDPIWLERPPQEIASQPEAVSTWTEQERRTILDALARSGGKVYGPNGAAALLNLKPTTLYSKMRKHQIQRTDLE
jgi:formate hydrogenlyase transcriptional activator